MPTKTTYSPGFYKKHESRSLASAQRVLASLLALGVNPPDAVVDVGCGRGTWLQACGEAGATRLVGLDGSWNQEHFDATSGLIDFHPIDLSSATLTALETATGRRRFNLGVSVEVVEHLPSAASETILDFLTTACDLVLFSAAIPGQGGTGHENEQWQSHWAQAFDERGYRAFDVLRPVLWSDPTVDFWYRQNLLLYSKTDSLGGVGPADRNFLDLVHPDQFARSKATMSGGDGARAIGRATVTYARRAAKALLRR